MAFKFPFTNYHELNLTWVLEQLKKLFEDSEENVETIESYENRLSAVETELPTVEATAEQAATTANAAASLAQTAKSTADTANENALTASAQAGLARQEAATAEAEAQAATQAAQQAQATAQNFDGRITQAEADASEALQEAQSFENRVNAAINTANNAANTATIAQGIAVNANQNVATALDAAQIAYGKAEVAQDTADQNADKIGDLSDLTTTAKNNLVAAINEAAQTGGGGTDNTKAPLIIANASGDVASFKDGADNMAIRHLIATINPIQAGTGDPSPSNVRPITGRTGLSGARTGTNILNPDILTISSSNIRTPTNTYFKLKKNTNYYFCSTIPVDGLYAVSKDGSTIAQIYNNQQLQFSVSEDTEATLNAYWSASKLPSGGLSKDLVYLNVGSNTGYSPFQGQTISVSWATEAGTVYGGTLDVITGELTITYGIVDLGTINYYYNSTYQYFNSYSDLLFPPRNYANCLCEMFVKTPNSAPTAPDNSVAVGLPYYGSGKVTVKTSLYDNVADFIAAVSGVKLVYELATPQTYQLDPATVNTLLGYNNIFTDSGPVSVDYPADTKLYIDGKIAELQALILEN